MEDHHDLRKFITGTVIAQRRDVLSSGRGARFGAAAAEFVRGAHDGPPVGPNDSYVSKYSHCGAAHSEGAERAGIKSSTRIDSDQMAAEALQEAETEVGVGILVVDRDADAAVRAAGPTYRSTSPAAYLGLMA